MQHCVHGLVDRAGADRVVRGVADDLAPREAQLRIAWREIIRNAAHDSICACSVDETVDAVLHRFQEARQIASAVAQRSLDTLARSIDTRGVIAVNATSRSRGGLIETAVSGDEFDPATMQIVEVRSALPESMLLDAPAMRTILSIIPVSY